jgi:hypothetical protein
MASLTLRVGMAYNRAMHATPRSSRLPLVAATLLLSANVVVPLVWGDVYPFTSAPMFRDCPNTCCNYRVVLPGGKEAPAAEWLVQRIYDGNPVGYGVGLCPPAVLEQQFGVAHEELAIRQHFERQLARPECGDTAIEVVQDVIGPIAGGRVGVVESRRWQIARPALNAETQGR